MKRIGQEWNPENEEFWQAEGKKHANRNLWITVPSLMCAFCIWTMWSIIAVNLNHIGFNFTATQITTLVATPGLVGATARVFYTFMPGIFGGRNWAIFQTAFLLVPAIGLSIALQDINTSYQMLLFLSILTGITGGNLSASTSNVGYFFPKNKKGIALGFVAGFGNLGVSLMQVSVTLGLLFIPFGTENGGMYLQNIAAAWVIPIIIVIIAIFFGMDNLPGTRQSIRSQTVILRKKHNWIMAIIYTCCFGSFIGFSMAFTLISQHMFPDSPYVQLAFLGPFISAAIRWLGGLWSDKYGGGIVTVYAFSTMIVATIAVIIVLENNGGFYLFLVMIMILFAAAGIANGSTFQMIPVIFKGKEEKYAGPVTGFNAAIGAYGGFFIPRIFGWSFQHFDSGTIAFFILLAYYAFSLALTIYYYVRKNAEVKC